ncbi:MAG: cysteine synthase family protein [Dehalococcoidia bacterium]|nr:cysteine synthase family protein [Dehalococcoidia bacterium]
MAHACGLRVVARNIVDAIGNTPLVEVERFSPKESVRIFAKLEGHNPTGSVKDRIAKYMIEQAEASGELTKDRVILESSSGNTGIALAMIARRKGYRLKVVIPDNLTPERVELLQVYGAEVVFSEGSRGPTGAIELAKAMAKEDDRYYTPYQYGNPANPLAHYETTGVEILEALPQVDAFVAGLGTGGTLMGVGRRLRERNPQVKIIGAVPDAGEEIMGLRGVDDGFIPPILDISMLSGRMLVSTSESFAATRELARREGIFAGISSGAAMHCSIRLAQKMENGNIVVLLADGGWKYLSTKLWTREASAGGTETKVWW